MAPIKSPKASIAAECKTLEQLPNVGPAMAGDLRGLGIHQPGELLGRDALALYRGLERHTGKRQDPCVLDTFMAVIAFMEGAAPKPWWAYTAERKRLHGALHEPVAWAPLAASARGGRAGLAKAGSGANATTATTAANAAKGTQGQSGPSSAPAAGC